MICEKWKIDLFALLHVSSLHSYTFLAVQPGSAVDKSRRVAHANVASRLLSKWLVRFVDWTRPESYVQILFLHNNYSTTKRSSHPPTPHICTHSSEGGREGGEITMPPKDDYAKCNQCKIALTRSNIGSFGICWAESRRLVGWVRGTGRGKTFIITALINNLRSVNLHT